MLGNSIGISKPTHHTSIVFWDPSLSQEGGGGILLVHTRTQQNNPSFLQTSDTPPPTQKNWCPILFFSFPPPPLILISFPFKYNSCLFSFSNTLYFVSFLLSYSAMLTTHDHPGGFNYWMRLECYFPAIQQKWIYFSLPAFKLLSFCYKSGFFFNTAFITSVRYLFL